MSSEQISEERRCPSCGARMRAGAKACWLCQEETAIRAGTPDQAARDLEILERIKLPKPQKEFGGMAVFGVLAVLVCIGLIKEAPGVLIILAVVAVPALIRTSVANQRQSEDAPLTGGAILQTFLSTLGLIVIVGLASFAAFYATCFVVCWGGLIVNSRGDPGWILVPSVGAGLVIGLLVAFRLFRRFWSQTG